MRFYADLHVHSKYSRATSKHADLEHLAYWAAKKGIALVGTGDFTHPAWLQEIKDKLVPAEPGLFRLRPEIEAEIKKRLPAACADNIVRFMLEVEISTIYKKGEKTRKVHHLIYAPTLDAAGRLIVSLSRIGNLKSDGRPILGLDSRDLLDLTLESDEQSYLIPAHIWTPWFAAMGSKSGFDSIQECYGDLAEHIFAVETGLSSDPEMNWRISSLDRYRLVSNSDAHSPIKLGREATAFDGALDYFGVKRALETGDGYVGTVEFFPDEGKYHLDGHRKCKRWFTPEQTKRREGICPECGEPLTVGVLHRIDDLADRRPSEAKPPATAGEAVNLVPLHEVIGEIEGTKPGSKRVERCYQRLVTSLGSELDILNEVPIEDIRRADGGLLGEAITRLRAGDVTCQGGYDGEYGVIRLFDDDELIEAKSGGLLIDLPKAIGENLPGANPMAAAPIPRVPKAARTEAEPGEQAPRQSEAGGAAAATQSNLFPRHGILAALDEKQRAAAAITRGPVLIVAGPGSGKTRTLTHRIAHLVAEEGVLAKNCLAITFTRRAALEMRGRLERLLPKDADRVPIHTFHSLGQTILQEQPKAARLSSDFRVADDIERTELIKALLDISSRQAKKLLAEISRSKRTAQRASDEVAAALEVYQPELVRRGWVDFDDLIGLTVRLLRNHDDLAAYYRERYAWISVDEFQDIDEQQYCMVQLLASVDANILAIGDPNQAIYGFRGADPRSFQRFRQDYPNAQTVTLRRNYRSSGTIVKASAEVIEAGEEGAASGLDHVRLMEERITVHRAASDKAEAEFIVHSIERLIGGHSFFSIDTGRTVDSGRAADIGLTTDNRAADRSRLDLSFADFAVLYRTDAQAKAVVEAFERSGMPYKKHNHDLLIEETAAQAILHRVDPVAKAAASEELKAAAAAVMREAEQEEIADLEATLQQLLALAASCEDRLDWFVDAVPLATEADCFDPRADRVSLLTIHAAKGLEFPVVFMIGLEDGILPLSFGKTLQDEERAEERRLAFVGMTRAMDRLFLSHAAKRTWRGSQQELPPSLFLGDLSEALFNTSRSDIKRKPADRQLQLF